MFCASCYPAKIPSVCHQHSILPTVLSVSQAWKCHFCFHPFFLAKLLLSPVFHYGEGKKVVNIKEKSAVTLNEDETGDVDHINANAAAQ